MITAQKLKTRIAKLLREAGVTEPPVPVEDIARNLGLIVTFAPYDGEMSGALIRDGTRAVVGVNALHPPKRQRFTIAHEIGHFLLHEGRPLLTDRSFKVNRRDTISSLAIDPEEVEANGFAAELLMPEQFMLRSVHALATHGIDLGDDELLDSLAREYEVSAQSMVIRLMKLGFRMETLL